MLATGSNSLSYVEMEFERAKEQLALEKEFEIRKEALQATNAKNYTKAAKLFIKLIDNKLYAPSDFANLNSHIYKQLVGYVSATSKCPIEHNFFDEYSYKEVQTIIFSYEEAAKNVNRNIREDIQIKEILSFLKPKIASCEKIVQELTKTCKTNFANFSLGAKNESGSFPNLLPKDIIDIIMLIGADWTEKNLVHFPVSKIEKMASPKNAGLQ